MHLLTFGVYEQILFSFCKEAYIGMKVNEDDEYATDAIKESDFVYMLLAVADQTGELNDQFNEMSESGRSSSTARYKKGTRPIPQDIAASFYQEGARDYAIDYFESYIYHWIRMGTREELIRKCLQLVKQDTTIDAELKAELVDEAKLETLSEFLVDLLIYVVAVDPTEKELIIPDAHFNLPPRNDWFTGRKDELARIENGFDAGERIQILYGMGGMGKTQIALKYVYDHYRSYTQIHWIDASSIDSIERSMKAFLQKTKQIENIVDDKAVSSVYLEYMNSRTDWLLIFDGCDYFRKEDFAKFVNCYLPNNPSVGNILITTRSNYRIGKAGRVEVYTLPKDEAVSFILTRTETSDIEQAEKLAKRLDYFPLAMEIACAYISTTAGCEINTYLNYLDSSTEWLEETEDVTNYDKTIRTIICLTLQRIADERGDDAVSKCIKAALKIASFSSPNGINFRAYEHLRKRADCAYAKEFLESEEYVGDSKDDLYALSDVCYQPMLRNDLTRTLIKYALLKDTGTPFLSMHPLQAEIIRNTSICGVANFSSAAYVSYYNYQYIDGLSHLEKENIAMQLSYIISDWSKQSSTENSTSFRTRSLQFLESSYRINYANEAYLTTVFQNQAFEEQKEAFNNLQETYKEIISRWLALKPEEVTVDWLTVFVEAFNTPIYSLIQTGQIIPGLACVRYCIAAICNTAKQLGIEQVIQADFDKDDKGIILPHYLETFLFVTKCIFVKSLHKKEYNERMVPYIDRLLYIVHHYAQEAKWSPEELGNYRQIVEAYRVGDFSKLPIEIQNDPEATYNAPFVLKCDTQQD